jgi:hypothetical protein
MNLDKCNQVIEGAFVIHTMMLMPMLLLDPVERFSVAIAEFNVKQL